MRYLGAGVLRPSAYHGVSRVGYEKSGVWHKSGCCEYRKIVLPKLATHSNMNGMEHFI
jgi:hypothetical protein